MILIKTIDYGDGVTHKHFSCGRKEWNKNGEIHRDDGPAVEKEDGSKYWYKYGTPHRNDGPATEFSNGSQLWFKDGNRHREDGPALHYSNGYQEWWIDGIQYTKQEFKAFKIKKELNEELATNLNTNLKKVKI